MKNTSRTLQNSIFEPLYSHPEELHFQSNMFTQPSSSGWLSQSLSPSCFIAPPSTKPTMKRAAATIFDESISGKDSSCNTAIEFARREHEPTACDHAILGMCSPASASSCIMPTSTPICPPSSSCIMPTSTPICPPSRTRSASDVVNHDDGSVASKLLSSITKSISSPSLLACCKESARETPYQKSLRLRTMKLQHCAEELGSESCDGSLCADDYINNVFDGVNRMSSSQSTRDFSKAHHSKSEGNASSMMISVRSSPNLGCASLVSKHTSPIKERSFPPPLSHTLPRSASSDSFSYSLRAYREDGHFVLKEVKVPCRQYFQASRKDGRLTLQRLTTDEDFESKHNIASDEAYKECRDLQEDDNMSVYGDVASDKAEGGFCDKIEVESANTANLAGGLEVCKRVKESKKSNHVGVDKSEEKNNMEEVGCVFAESLLMATLSHHGNSCSVKNDKVNLIPHGGDPSKTKSDFKSAKRKMSDKALRIRSANRHLLSSSLNYQQSLLHLPARSPKLKLGHDFDAAKLSGFEIMSASCLRKSGSGIGKSTSSTIILKDVSAKCLMENVSKLVASFGLECRGKWSCGEQIKARELDKNSGGIMESSMYKGIKSINISRAREIESGSHESTSGGVSFNREGECVVNAARSCHPSSCLHFDERIPSSTAGNRAPALQGKEWLHTLHCKELNFDRNLAKGAFMKLHCVA